MLTDRPTIGIIVRDLLTSDATVSRRAASPVKLQQIFSLFYTVIGLHFDTALIGVARTSFARKVSDLIVCPRIGR